MCRGMGVYECTLYGDRARTVSGLFACMYGVGMELCMCAVFCTYSALHRKSRQAGCTGTNKRERLMYLLPTVCYLYILYTYTTRRIMHARGDCFGIRVRVR